MIEPFIGEIRIFPYGTTPKGWMPCDGRELRIPDHQALYVLLNGKFGSDKKTVFNLPDLRGRVIVGQGRPKQGTSNYAMGQCGGAEMVTLTLDQIPAHTHDVNVRSDAATRQLPTGDILAVVTSPDTAAKTNTYAPGGKSKPQITLEPQSIAPAGGGQSHPNMQPFLALNYCICVIGIYPPKQ